MHACTDSAAKVSDIDWGGVQLAVLRRGHCAAAGTPGVRVRSSVKGRAGREMADTRRTGWAYRPSVLWSTHHCNGRVAPRPPVTLRQRTPRQARRSICLWARRTHSPSSSIVPCAWSLHRKRRDSPLDSATSVLYEHASLRVALLILAAARFKLCCAATDMSEALLNSGALGMRTGLPFTAFTILRLVSPKVCVNRSGARHGTGIGKMSEQLSFAWSSSVVEVVSQESATQKRQGLKAVPGWAARRARHSGLLNVTAV